MSDFMSENIFGVQTLDLGLSICAHNFGLELAVASYKMVFSDFLPNNLLKKLGFFIETKHSSASFEFIAMAFLIVATVSTASF